MIKNWEYYFLKILMAINSAINRWLFFKNIRYQNLIKKTGNQLWFPVFEFVNDIVYQPATLA